MHKDNIILDANKVSYSCRSELSSLIGGLHCITSMRAKWRIENPIIKANCNRQEVIIKADRAHFKPTTPISYFNLAPALYHAINLL